MSLIILISLFINKGSIRAIGFVLLILTGFLSARTSSPINLSKASSIYYKTGQADYGIFGNKNFEEYGILLSRFIKSKSYFIDIGFKYNKMDFILNMDASNNKIIAKTLIFNIHCPRILFLNPIVSYEFQVEDLGMGSYGDYNFLITYHNQIYSMSSIYKISSRLSFGLSVSKLFTEDVTSYPLSVFYSEPEEDGAPILNNRVTSYKYEYHRANFSAYFLLHKNLLLSSDISFSTHDTRERDISLTIQFQI